MTVSGGAERACISADTDVLPWRERREVLLFFPSPSFAPIFFQLFPDMALWKVLGEPPWAKSDMGGVVGGVIGSTPGVEFGLLSSVTRSASLRSVAVEIGRWDMRLIPSSGRKAFLGDWLASSPEKLVSLEIRSRDRPCLDS